MSKLIQTLLQSIQKFNATDFVLLKLYLLSIGTLSGTYFSSFFIKHISIVWSIATTSFIFVLVALVKYSLKK